LVVIELYMLALRKYHMYSTWKKVTFVGSRAERELRKRKSRKQSPTTAAGSIENSHTSLEDSIESNVEGSRASERSMSPPRSTVPYNQSEGLTESLLHESNIEDATDTTLAPRNITRAEYC
jgi:hypothetical protein